jgi:hypothetical protein
MKARNLSEQLFPKTTLLPGIGLLVEFGEQHRETMASLKQGEGPLAWQIEEIFASWRDRLELGADADADAEVVPVILIYRKAKPDYVVIASTVNVSRWEGN